MSTAFWALTRTSHSLLRRQSPAAFSALSSACLPATSSGFASAVISNISAAMPMKRARAAAGKAANTKKSRGHAAPKCTVDISDAEAFLKFVDASPSPFHAVATATEELENAGFKRLSEKDKTWTLIRGGKYFMTRNESSLVAFVVGEKWVPGNGFSLVAAHTDSPCLKLKPRSANTKSGYLSVGVETYGGGLWSTWFDRDLSVAGRVIVKDEDGAFATRLVKIDRSLMRVPSLAIHLNRSIRTDGFKWNDETHLAPVLATEIKAAIGKPAASAATGAGAGAGAGVGANDGSLTSRGGHHEMLIEVLAEELGVEPEAIHDFELCLYDTQPAAIGGLKNEFIFAPRLDNLMMSYTSLEALLASCTGDTLRDDPNIRMIALFDNEEVGSGSMMGAGSTMMIQLLSRISEGMDKTSAAIKKSLLISADMAHAVHPNYAEKHECKHKSAMHAGVVIKYNANQRYATTSLAAFLLRQVAAEAGVPMQEFVVRQDSACGSTIGPMLSASTGMRTVDIGIAQLAMHSIREMCGVDDVSYAIQLFTHFFNSFAEINARLTTSDD